MRSILVAPVAALVFMTATGFAADSQRGRQYARRVCSICHSISKDDSEGDPNAPSFQSIAKSRQFREKGVARLWERHPKMPDLATTKDDLEDVAAYIRSLAK